MTNELEKQFFQCFGIESKQMEFDIGASVNASILVKVGNNAT